MLQWKGLPYGECTWETWEDVQRAGGYQAAQDFAVGWPCCALAAPPPPWQKSLQMVSWAVRFGSLPHCCVRGEDDDGECTGG